MTATAASKPVRSVLFACNMNAVRSPMAEAVAQDHLGPDVKVESCGAYAGSLDPLVAEVLEEAGLPRPTRAPRDFAKMDPAAFDVVIALSGEAAGQARRQGAKPEFWETSNPSEVRDTRDERMAALRALLEELRALVAERFGARRQG